MVTVTSFVSAVTASICGPWPDCAVVRMFAVVAPLQVTSVSASLSLAATWLA